MVMSLQEQLVKMQSVSMQAASKESANSDNNKQTTSENKSPPQTSKSSICVIQQLVGGYFIFFYHDLYCFMLPDFSLLSSPVATKIRAIIPLCYRFRSKFFALASQCFQWSSYKPMPLLSLTISHPSKLPYYLFFQMFNIPLCSSYLQTFLD